MEAPRILLLSGPVCAGKSTLAAKLVERYASYGVRRLRTQDLIKVLKPKAENTREALQKAGESLDKSTKGSWVRDALVKEFTDFEQGSVSLVIVDAVRIESQVEAIRGAFGRAVVHAHLTASRDTLSERYVHRNSDGMQEFTSYAQVEANKTEKKVDRLREIADICIDSERCTEEDIVVRAASRVGLYGRGLGRSVDVMVGGQFGSEGKGQVAAYLASDYDVLIRVGGPNAGHKVFGDPPYTFHHLPSGTVASPRSKLILGPGAVLNPRRLQEEIGECDVDASRLVIDPQAMIITENDIAAEAEMVKAISSTGQGVGEATARKILGRRAQKTQLARDVDDLKPYVRPAIDVIEESFATNLRVLLEGTQGTGLSLHHGHYPHVTSRDTTVAGCLAEAGISPSRVRKVILVCRTYPIRVQGAHSGPMSQEIDWPVVAERSGISLAELQECEKTSTTNRKRRVAEFDWNLMRQACQLNAPTDIALTFADYISVKNRAARRFDQLTEQTIHFIEEVECVAQAPVSLISTRFHSRSIIDRRSW